MSTIWNIYVDDGLFCDYQYADSAEEALFKSFGYIPADSGVYAIQVEYPSGSYCYVWQPDDSEDSIL